MQFENNIPHPHYKKVVIGITIFIVAVVLAVLGYYFFSVKKAEKARDLTLRAEYQQGERDKAAKLFDGLGKNVKAPTEADKKNLTNLFKDTPAQMTSEAEVKAIIDLLGKQHEEAYQEWKVNHQ